VTDKSREGARSHVEFTKPPVVEVACGVLFFSPQPLLSAHVGAFWDRVRSEFPRVEDAPPLPSVVEQLGVGTGQALEFSSVPPLRRSWMLSEDGRNLIQLQQDRFLFNWKRTADGDSYPHYSAVVEQFERHLDSFLTFFREVASAEVSFRQFELVYVNHISKANGLDITGLDSLLVDHIRDRNAERFLPEPEGLSWSTAYALPDGRGRLHVAAQTAINLPTNEKLVRLDLTARGISLDASAEGRRQWFDMAHEWITRGFADVTSPTLHDESVWGRTS